MDTLEAIKARRSVRRFGAAPVPADELRLVLEAGRSAPSWGNTQCWQLVVVTDAAVTARLADAMAATNPGTGAVRDAPVVIAVCAELGKAGYIKGKPNPDKRDWYMFDAGLCAENMCLAAADLGLGTVIIGLSDHARIGEILKLPSGVVSVVLLPLGYPEQSPELPRRTPRKELVEFVFQNEHGVRYTT